MSNVFAKDHKPTGIEFLDLCPQIEILTVRFLKANVPKSYTNIYTIHIAKTARTICNCIEEANASYPSDSRRLKKRRALINEALDKIEVLIKELTRLLEVLPDIDPNKLNQLGQVLIKETELLKGWRDSTTRTRAQKQRAQTKGAESKHAPDNPSKEDEKGSPVP